MATQKEAARTIHSASNETGVTIRTVARATTHAAVDPTRQTAQRDADTAKQSVETAGEQFGRVLNFSAEMSQRLIN